MILTVSHSYICSGEQEMELAVFLFTHFFPHDPLEESGRIVRRWKDILKEITVPLESWETVH